MRFRSGNLPCGLASDLGLGDRTLVVVSLLRTTHHASRSPVDVSNLFLSVCKETDPRAFAPVAPWPLWRQLFEPSGVSSRRLVVNASICARLDVDDFRHGGITPQGRARHLRDWKPRATASCSVAGCAVKKDREFKTRPVCATVRNGRSVGRS